MVCFRYIIANSVQTGDNRDDDDDDDDDNNNNNNNNNDNDRIIKSSSVCNMSRGLQTSQSSGKLFTKLVITLVIAVNFK